MSTEEELRAAAELAALSSQLGDEPVTVCVTHLRFVPCRKNDGCIFSSAPDDVEKTRMHHEIAQLKEKIRRQAGNIDDMRKVLERKNRELDALHLVWCDGSCPGGVHRWNPDLVITEELAETAERNTRRLRSWYEGVRFRSRQLDKITSDWYCSYIRQAMAKTDLGQHQHVPGVSVTGCPESSAEAAVHLHNGTRWLCLSRRNISAARDALVSWLKEHG